MIVTIDGPAGAGKSSVAKRLAQELGFNFLDTGAMYRCVTLACLRQNVSFENKELVSEIAKTLGIELNGSQVFLDGENVSEAIRTPAVTQSIRPVADNIAVREAMVEAQRKWVAIRDVVTEGRDQGTIAFPHAECKIFLTASPEERARRRVAQLIELGLDANYQEILAMQNLRDAQDIQRERGGLKPAPDAVTVWTDGLTEEQVLRRLVEIVESKRTSQDACQTDSNAEESFLLRST